MPYDKSEAAMRARAKYNAKTYYLASATFLRSQKELLQEMARRSGMTVGRFIRVAVYEKAERDFPDLEIRKLERSEEIAAGGEKEN